jgi:CRISPR/Cas system endoribonuclease Cas6 (RAMP superfamily)
MQHKILTAFFDLPTDKIESYPLSELFGSAIYLLLPDERHGGVINQSNKKRYSDFVFNVVKIRNRLRFNFSSMVDEDYKILTEAILENRFKLGDIHISKTSVAIENITIDTNEPIFVKGIVSLNRREGKKRVFRDIRDDDFINRLESNLFAKTSALIGHKHNFMPKFEIAQIGRSHVIFYKRIGYLAHEVVLKSLLDEKSANILFHAGLGSGNTKGIGFMRAV